MLSSEVSYFWKWRWAFIVLTVLVTGFIFFKNKNSVVEVLPQFQIAPLVASQTATPFYQEETIDPAATYRMAHVASMTELPDGTLVTTWYAGSGELQPDVKIYCSMKPRGQFRHLFILGSDTKINTVVPKFTNDGTDPLVWAEPQVIMTREQASRELECYVKGLGNALIFSGDDGVLQLLYVTVAVGKWSGSQLNLISSRDQGRSWAKSRRLFLSPLFNLSELVKNAPISLVGGGWAIPIYQEFLGKFPELLWLWPNGEGFLTATKSRIAGGCSFFQPSVTALDPKKAVAFCRDYQTSGKICRSETNDGGKSWTTPRPLDLPNHDSGIASVRLSNGDLLLAFNDSNTSARNILRLALSRDEGTTWQRIATIAEEPQGDFCYPYFFESHDGSIHLLYSWQRRHIRHVTFNKAWVHLQEEKLKKKIDMCSSR